ERRHLLLHLGLTALERALDRPPLSLGSPDLRVRQPETLRTTEQPLTPPVVVNDHLAEEPLPVPLVSLDRHRCPHFSVETGNLHDSHSSTAAREKRMRFPRRRCGIAPRAAAS